MRSNHNKKNIEITDEAKKDISWFNVFLDQFNGTSFFKKEKMQGIVHLDACLTGLGAVHCNEIYHCKIPTCLQDCPIVVREILTS